MVSYVLFCWWFRLPALAKAWEIIRNYRAQNKTLTPMKVKAVS
jgi:hypothetical protein